MSKDNEAYKSIGEVAKLLNLVNKKNGNLNTHTLRYWEKEFKQIKPKIFTGNRRYYDKKTINTLKKVKFLLKDQGMTVNGVKKLLNNPEIVDNVVVMGKYIKTSLENEPIIKEIRQHGLMIGIEFLFNDYNPALALKLVTRLRDKGVLVLVAGNKSQYIRLLPPLNIDQEDIDVFLHTFKKILAQESGIFCR